MTFYLKVAANWILAAVMAVLIVVLTTGVAAAGPCYHYANLVGQHHAAWWHGYYGAPAVVDWEFPGVATGDWGVAFGTRLCIEVVGVPDWAAQEYGYLIGRRAVGVVVDRMPPGYEGALDAWPALARELMGKDWLRVGVVVVEYWVCEDRIWVHTTS